MNNITKYCWMNKDQKHCHCFQDGIYIGFETDGKMETEYSAMTMKWREEKRTEKDLANFLNIVGFKKEN